MFGPVRADGVVKQRDATKEIFRLKAKPKFMILEKKQKKSSLLKYRVWFRDPQGIIGFEEVKAFTEKHAITKIRHIKPDVKCESVQKLD